MREYMIQKSKQIGRLLTITAIVMLAFLSMEQNASAKADESFMKTKKAELNVVDFGAVNNATADKSVCTATAKAFQAAFDEVEKYNLSNGEYVQINVPAGTYCIDRRIRIRSNTYLKLDANATIKNLNRSSGGSMLANYYVNSSTTYYGYNGAQNIVVDGGTWDGNVSGNDISKGFSNIIFVHCKNVIVKNTTVKSNYQGHLIEFAGVQNGHILNSVLSDYVSKTETAASSKDKEAIQLDITHDSEMVPTMGGYDDTVCNDIVIKGNRIENFSRGIGSHAAVKGIYNQNILIQGNTFVNIPNEGVLAFNYRKTQIDGNTFTNVGTSIKIKNKTGTVDSSYKAALSGTATEFPSNYEISVTNNKINSTLAGTTAEIILEDTNERVLGNTKVSGNTISTAKYGISLKGTKSSDVSSNNITNAKRGIVIQYSNGDSITSNSIANCTDGSIINDAKSSNLSIQQNIINGGKSYGIRLYNIQNATVANNQINNTGLTAIYAYNSCSGINVSGNMVNNSSGYGILFNTAISNSVIQGNVVLKSAKKGITVCTRSSNIQILNNEIGYNKLHGIDVNENCSNITISGNKSYNNSQVGIFVNNNVTGVNIVSNNAYKNTQNGIGIKTNCSNVTINKNEVHKSGKIGISVNSKSNNVVITSNVVKNNGSNGIGVSDSSLNATITSNTVASNSKHGISIYNGSNKANIQKNKVSKSGQAGICISKNSTNAKVVSNTLSSNKSYAIYVTNSNSATIKTNSLTSNKTTPIKIKSSKKASVSSFSLPKMNAATTKTKILKVTTSKNNRVTAYVGKKKLKVTKNTKATKNNFTAKYSKLKKNNKVSVYIYDKGNNKVTLTKTVK